MRIVRIAKKNLDTPALRHTAIFLALTAVVILTPSSADAADIRMFPRHHKALTAETLPYAQVLHSGIENDTFYMRGRFGVDFPIVGYSFNADNNADIDNANNPRAHNIVFGIAAAAHINMRPTSNMRFPVDNFYAVLALYFSGAYGSNLTWRLYPVYHVSAHLADGYRGGDIIRENVRAVSSEMVRAEIYYDLFGDFLEIGAGAGWYYHVCAQKGLAYRADVSMLVAPYSLMPTIGRTRLLPYALLRAENVYQNQNNPGIDLSAGIIAFKDSKGLGLNLRYFNRLHSGYYFEAYERGYGLELMFMY